MKERVPSLNQPSMDAKPYSSHSWDGATCSPIHNELCLQLRVCVNHGVCRGHTYSQEEVTHPLMSSSSWPHRSGGGTFQEVLSGSPSLSLLLA